MRRYLIAIPAALLLAAPAANSGTSEVKLSDKQQAKFEKKIAGRVSGEPVSCISRIDQKNMTVIGDKYLIYQRSSNPRTIYVNEPYGGCRNVDRGALVTRSSHPSLCRGEIAEVQDLTTGIHYDSCAFGDFVPYTKTSG